MKGVLDKGAVQQNLGPAIICPLTMLMLCLLQDLLQNWTYTCLDSMASIWCQGHFHTVADAAAT